MNLHHIVRGAITTVNPDVQGTIFQSTGHTTFQGIVTPTFSSVVATIQVQPEKHTPLQHDRGVLYDTAYLNIYAYGAFQDLGRPQGVGGDIVALNGQWWYITQAFEMWPDWCLFQVTQQLAAGSLPELLNYLRATGRPLYTVPGAPGE